MQLLVITSSGILKEHVVEPLVERAHAVSPVNLTSFLWARCRRLPTHRGRRVKKVGDAVALAATCFGNHTDSVRAHGRHASHSIGSTQGVQK